MSQDNRSNKNKFARSNSHQQVMAISVYIKRKEDFKNLPGKLIDGVMKVFFNDEWITEGELHVVFPPPFVADFTGDKTNIDTTRSWIYN